MWKTVLVSLVLVVAVLGGAYVYGKAQHTTAINDNSSVHLAVSQFGTLLQKVSLQGADVKNTIGEYYSPYVAASLLSQWEANPVAAPGRAASSSWPDRIQVNNMTQGRDGSYTVNGTIIEMSSKEAAKGGTAGQYPVTLTLVKSGDQWLITSFVRQ
jgi:hypothetical protein